MHLVITHNHAAAMDLISQRVNQHFGRSPDYFGDSLHELLSTMPILSKKDLIDHGENKIDLLLHQSILFSETSGTTSAPLQTPRNKHDLNWNVINQINAYKPLVQAGVDRVCLLHPSVLSPFIEGSARALYELGVGHVRLYPIPKVCEYKRIYDVIDRYRITTLMSTPSLVYKILYELKIIGSGKLPRSLQKILLTGERFSRENAYNMQRIIGEGSFVTPFVYGSSETATIMVGQPDCTYRPITEDFVFEILNNEQADDSLVHGNLLVTWLRGGMLPILRYDTGDLFTAQRVRNSDEYTFLFNGRLTNDGLSIHEQKIIETIVYQLPSPIFHFECLTDTDARKINIDLIIDSKSAINPTEIQLNIQHTLKDSWHIVVNINSKNNHFFDFSPSPKTRKFQRA